MPYALVFSLFFCFHQVRCLLLGGAYVVHCTTTSLRSLQNIWSGTKFFGKGFRNHPSSWSGLLMVLWCFISPPGPDWRRGALLLQVSFVIFCRLQMGDGASSDMSRHSISQKRNLVLSPSHRTSWFPAILGTQCRFLCSNSNSSSVVANCDAR